MPSNLPTPEYMIAFRAHLDEIESPAERSAFLDWVIGGGVEGLLHGDPDITAQAAMIELAPAVTSLALGDGEIGEMGQAIFLALFSHEYEPVAIEWLGKRGIGKPEILEWFGCHPHIARLAFGLPPTRQQVVH